MFMANKPWEKCGQSWIYEAVWPKWWNVDWAEIALSKWDTFPPAHGKWNKWKLKTKTKWGK